VLEDLLDPVPAALRTFGLTGFRRFTALDVTQGIPLSSRLRV